nr:MAG TPA: hypothetical protein [Caudoviricetes sp.]
MLRTRTVRKSALAKQGLKNIRVLYPQSSSTN